MSDLTSITDEEFGKLDFNELMSAFDDYAEPQQQEQNQPQENYEQPVEENTTEDNQYTTPDQDNTSAYQGDDDTALYKEVYDRITAPFKASGKEFQVRNIDEAISLMQKGVDYTRKQQALKPRLAEMRTLEEQGMLGANLNYAIDLFRGNPQAIAKLIKEKGIDVNQFLPKVDEFGNPETNENTPTYIPNNYGKSPDRQKFDEVIDTLKDEGMYDTVDRALDHFDAESKRYLCSHPDSLLRIRDYINNGQFQTIVDEMERAKIVGNPLIQGKADVESFAIIASQLGIGPNGAYTQQQQYAQPQQYNQQQQQQYIQQQQQYQAVQQRKQGVSPVRSTPGRAITQYDPLTCSDEDFAKIDINELMRR